MPPHSQPLPPCYRLTCRCLLARGDRRANDAERNLLANVKKQFASGAPSLQALLAQFKSFDLDGSGFISASELRRAMQDLGYHLSNEEVQVLMNRFNQSGSGGISYQDFADHLITMLFEDIDATDRKTRTSFGLSSRRSVAPGATGVDRAEAAILRFVSTLMKRGQMPARAALLRAFSDFDTDGNNTIDKQELARWFATWDVEMTDGELQVLLVGGSCMRVPVAHHRPLWFVLVQGVMDRFRAGLGGVRYTEFVDHILKLAAARGGGARDGGVAGRSSTATGADGAEEAIFRRITGAVGNKMSELARLFRECDSNSSGAISPAELRRALNDMGVTLTDDELKVRGAYFVVVGGVVVVVGTTVSRVGRGVVCVVLANSVWCGASTGIAMA